MILAHWFWRRWFFKFHQCIFTISKLYPLRKGPGPSFEQFLIPLPKDDLCQILLKLAQWLWRRRFLKFVNVFSLFHNYLPLKKGRDLHLNKLAFPSPKDALCQVLLKLAQWFWRRRWKYENFTITTTTTDNGKFWSEKLTLAFGSGELKE